MSDDTFARCASPAAEIPTGSWKNSGRKYLFLKHKKQKYHIQSNNLELVTVIECISTAGEVVPPSFCLQEGAWPDLRGLDDNQWGR
jgi:hypothetical protein